MTRSGLVFSSTRFASVPDKFFWADTNAEVDRDAKNRATGILELRSLLILLGRLSSKAYMSMSFAQTHLSQTPWRYLRVTYDYETMFASCYMWLAGNAALSLC